MRFPVDVVPAPGGGGTARALGDAPSSALLAWWAAGRDPGAGFRWAPGTRGVRQVTPVERPVEVDQTNRSVIVGDAVVVKWATTTLSGPHPAPERLRRLVAAGFASMPAVWFALEWQTPEGDWVPVVTAVDLVPGASDGWTWCLREARVALGREAGEEQPFAEHLGLLTAEMHLALADAPTGPVATHGDLHVGQVLRDPHGALFVIDFDGNPTLPPHERVAHRPAAYDVAGMLLSLENVGHVVRRYHPDLPDPEVLAWTRQVQGEFLSAYRATAPSLLDEALIERFVDDQIERELAYADAHLPAWRYVPEAALRRRGRR